MIANRILPSSHSTSVISLPYEINSLIPDRKHEYAIWENGIESLDILTTQYLDYGTNENEKEKLQTVLDFSRKVIENMEDIDSEFVDIVNDNFWDLI